MERRSAPIILPLLRILVPFCFLTSIPMLHVEGATGELIVARLFDLLAEHAGDEVG